MTKQNNSQTHCAIELILDDGMSISAAADMAGATSEEVETWLAEYQKQQDEILLRQDADIKAAQKRIDELQEEIRIHRAMYDLVMTHPDPVAERIAKKHWDTLSDKAKQKIITNAYCIDCGALSSLTM